jgi:hypothetical protein
MKSFTRRERVRRVSLAIMAVSAPLPVAGVALSGSGLPWAILPAAAGVVTVTTMRAKRVPAPIPAPPVYPERITRVDAYTTPAHEPGPDLNALRELVAAEPWPGREAA